MLFYSYILHTYISQHYYICIVLFIYSIFFSYLPCRHTYHMIQTSRAGIRREIIHLSRGWGGIVGSDTQYSTSRVSVFGSTRAIVFVSPYLQSFFWSWIRNLQFRVHPIVASQLWVSPTVRRRVFYLDKYITSGKLLLDLLSLIIVKFLYL